MREIASNNFFKVSVDTSKNRMYTVFSDFWSEDIMDNYMSSLDTALSLVSSNFTLVADLREFKTLSPNLVPKQKMSMQKLGGAGMFKVAEILPASVISKMQLNSSAQETKMPNRQFSSISEGEQWLDNEVKNL